MIIDHLEKQEAALGAIILFWGVPEMNRNKMELLQSQAPVDWELSGSSASDRHGALDIRHQTWDIGIWKY